MIKRPLVYIYLILVLGEVLLIKINISFWLLWAILTLVMALYSVFCLFKGERKIPPIFFVSILMLFLQNNISVEEGRINISGHISNIKIKQYETEVSLKTNKGMYLVLVKSDFVYSRGDIINVDGEIKKFNRPYNQGEFDEKTYYKSLGYVSKIKANNIKFVKEKCIGRAVIEKIRTHIKRNIMKSVDYRYAGIYKAIILGEKEDLEDSIKSIYKMMGIFHILAISGLHITLIGGGIFKLLRKLGVLYFKSTVISIIFISIYAILIGDIISAKRAVIMFILYVISQALGRKYDLLSALSMAGIYLLIKNPYVIFNSGYILSFGAVLSFAILLPAIKKNFKKEKFKKIQKYIIPAISVFLFMLPINIYVFYEIPILSIIFNIIFIPLMPIVVISGIIGGVFRISLMLKLGSLILFIYEHVGVIVSSMNISLYITGSRPYYIIVVYYMILLIYVVLSHKFPCRKNHLLLILLLVIFIRPNLGTEINYIYLNKGESILISNNVGEAMLVDWGYRGKKDASKYTVEALMKNKGIKKIKYAFITNFDKEHFNGIIKLIKNNKIESIVVKLKDKDNVEIRKLKEVYGDKLRVISLKSGDSINYIGRMISSVDKGYTFVSEGSKVLMPGDSREKGFIKIINNGKNRVIKFEPDEAQVSIIVSENKIYRGEIGIERIDK